MAPPPVLLPGKSHGRGSLVGCGPWGRWESGLTGRLHFHFSLSCIGEGNGNPLKCSCLENPRDGGAWWEAVYGVAQSWTRLKRLSSSSSSSDLRSLLKSLVSRPLPESESVGLGCGSGINTASSVPRWFCRALGAAVLYCSLTGVLWNVSLQGGSSVYGLDTITLRWLKLCKGFAPFFGWLLLWRLSWGLLTKLAPHLHFLHSQCDIRAWVYGKSGDRFDKMNSFGEGR